MNQSHGSGQGRQISDDGKWEWDGNQWQPRAQATQPPPGPQPGQQPYYVAPPKKKHTLRNVLLILVLLFVLFVGGCIALIGGAVNEVDKAIKENDNRAGGANNPLTIEEGEAFEVDGFNYAAGWSIGKDPVGDIAIRGLKVTNNRDDRDSALVEIKFWKGSEVLTSVDCTTNPIAPGTTVTLSCLSADKLPQTYNKITINDTF